MANEVFVAFWAGACCGVVFGAMMTAVLAAMAAKEQRKENDNDEV
jgi:hypothetical protein